jgi:hypothetical protein
LEVIIRGLGRAVRTAVSNRQFTPQAIGLAYHLLHHELYSREEIQRLSLLNLTDKARAKLLSRRSMTALMERLNPEPWRCLLRNKALFYQHCTTLQLPTPKLLALILPGRTGWIPKGNAPGSPSQWTRFLGSECPAELAVKPISGNYGSGIRILTRTDNGHFHQLGDEPITCDNLAEHLFHDPNHPGYILQERIYNHPDLLALSQAQGLQCVRLIVMTDPQGQSHILHAHLKIIVGDNPHDNFQFGNSGNLLARVDVTTGSLSSALNRNPSGPGYIELTHHPGTRQQITGLNLPHWPATCRLVRKASQLLQPLRVIGWDVAITPNGPVIIEGNWNSDPPNPFRNLDTFCDDIRRLES